MGVIEKIIASGSNVQVTVNAKDLQEFAFYLLDGKQPSDGKPDEIKNLVYGIRGIQELFNVSYKTAHIYKETIIKDAVYQQGRKIVVDADKALELFKKKKGV